MAEKKREKIKTWTRIPNLINLAYDAGVVWYVILLSNSELQIKKEYEDIEIESDDEGKEKKRTVTVCRPKQDLPIKMCSVKVNQEIKNRDYKKLLTDIISFIKRYLEMPQDIDYLTIALWIMHSYVMEKFDTTPYLYFYGCKETGKSKAAEILHELSFFCLWITSPTEASIFRPAKFWEPAMIIDEIALWGEEKQSMVAQLIKTRYKRGLSVPRVNLNKNGEDSIEYSPPFGALVLATTEEVPPIIESRCITFLMQKNENPGVESKLNKAEALKLRDRLSCFRAHALMSEFPEVKIKARRRLKEITEPLYQVLSFVDNGRLQDFDDFVSLIELSRETDDRNSFEAELTGKLVESISTNESTWISTDDITRALNVGILIEKDRYTDRKISMTMKKVGFESRRVRSIRGWTLKVSLLEKLTKQYGIDFDVSQFPST